MGLGRGACKHVGGADEKRVFSDICNPPWRCKPFPQFYAETLDHMQAMNELGFEAISEPARKRLWATCPSCSRMIL